MTAAQQLSVVIPVLNEAQLIEERLQRLQPLRAQGAELLVVDGGSDDESREKALPLADKVLRSQRGRARQMNYGAAEACGDWLLFLHLDTELPAPACASLLAELARPGVQWGWFDVQLDNPRWPYRMIATAMNLRARVTRVCTGDQSVFVRRNLFSRVGGFPVLPLMEDVAFSKQLRRQAAPRVLGSRVTTSSRRWEKHGVARTILLMWRLRLLYFLGVSPAKLVAQYYPENGSMRREQS